MPDYRCNRIPGGTYFFTVNLQDRRPGLLVERLDLLRDAVRLVRARTPFHIHAWVVLPDHMHWLWTLPDGDDDFPGRWRAIKIAFSKALPVQEYRSATRTTRGERGIWQRRYWSTRSATTGISWRIWTTFISTRLSTAWLRIGRIDRIHRFAAMSRRGFIRPHGPAPVPNRRRRASGGECYRM